jgi:hypothetical protein
VKATLTWRDEYGANTCLAGTHNYSLFQLNSSRFVPDPTYILPQRYFVELEGERLEGSSGWASRCPANMRAS